ncbi:hypothetical protein CERSUDRAFT_107787, partial [Gelatoporia subvermispora B]
SSVNRPGPPRARFPDVGVRSQSPDPGTFASTKPGSTAVNNVTSACTYARSTSLRHALDI